MKLQDIGEFGLIARLAQDTIVNGADVVVGIGDDTAVLRPAADRYQLVTTDMLVENIHFTLAASTLRQVGYKALAVNISDIAAMGGVPRHAVVAVALPPRLSVEAVLALYDGLKDAGRDYDVNIVGGDTVASREGLVINVTVLGEAGPHGVIRRSGARVGDVLAVTGTLGDAAAGLAVLAAGKLAERPFAPPLLAAHRQPRPLVAAGQALAAAGASSMDDISDGLASEAHEIAGASKVGLEIDAAAVPISAAARAAAAALGHDPLDWALYGGEDFQLVFTIAPDHLAAARTAPVSVTAIGRVVSPEQGVTLRTGQDLTPLAPRGYNHFVNLGDRS